MRFGAWDLRNVRELTDVHAAPKFSRPIVPFAIRCGTDEFHLYNVKLSVAKVALCNPRSFFREAEPSCTWIKLPDLRRKGRVED